jgi:hypothetical protein
VGPGWPARGYAYGNRRAFKAEDNSVDDLNTKEGINAFRGDGELKFPLRQVFFSFLPIEGAVLSMLVEGNDPEGVPSSTQIAAGQQRNSIWGGPSALMLYCECPGTDDVSRKWNFRALNDQILYNYPRNLHKVAAPPGVTLADGLGDGLGDGAQAGSDSSRRRRLLDEAEGGDMTGDMVEESLRGFQLHDIEDSDAMSAEKRRQLQSNPLRHWEGAEAISAGLGTTQASAIPLTKPTVLRGRSGWRYSRTLNNKALKNF